MKAKHKKVTFCSTKGNLLPGKTRSFASHLVINGKTIISTIRLNAFGPLSQKRFSFTIFCSFVNYHYLCNIDWFTPS